MGGSPVAPSEDVLLARAMTRSATVEQLQRLLGNANPAVRAHVVREIGLVRPKDADLVKKLVSDRTAIRVGNMADHAPFVDRNTTVGQLAKDTLEIAAQGLPPIR